MSRTQIILIILGSAPHYVRVATLRASPSARCFAPLRGLQAAHAPPKAPPFISLYLYMGTYKAELKLKHYFFLKIRIQIFKKVVSLHSNAF